MPRGSNFLTMVHPNGDIEILDPVGLCPDLLEYTAAVSRFRKATHDAKATERQRLLDAVRETEEAVRAADERLCDARTAHIAARDAARKAGAL
jgi:hypothetical protein